MALWSLGRDFVARLALGGMAAGGMLLGALASCTTFGSYDPGPPDGGVGDASPKDSAAADVAVGPFTCDPKPAFEAPFDLLPSGVDFVGSAIVVAPPVVTEPHLVVVPFDFDGGTTERGGGVWVQNVLAGRTGFRVTFEYSIYTNGTMTGGEGFALGWVSDSVPALGGRYGVCPLPGSNGQAIALETSGALPAPKLLKMADCAVVEAADALTGASLSNRAAPGPSPWYSIDVTVMPDRIAYNVGELGSSGNAGLMWGRSFKNAGGGTSVKAVGITAHTGGMANAAHRVRKLKIFGCSGS